MTSLPAAAAFNNDVLSYVSCIQCRTGQKYKTCFSNDLLQLRRKGRSRVPRAATVRSCQLVQIPNLLCRTVAMPQLTTSCEI